MKKEVKQVILVRRDLNMSPGKIASQVAHASLGALLLNMNTYQHEKDYDYVKELTYNITDPIYIWLHYDFTKICLGVDSEEELVELYNKAKYKKLPCSLIEDEGRTEFNNVITKTTAAIGPDWSYHIDEITGSLKLL